MSDCVNCEDCNDATPPVILPAPPECEGEQCEEIVEAKCVRYTGAAIPCLEITTGDDMDSVVQKLAFCLNDAFAAAMLDYILADEDLKGRLCTILNNCP